MRQNPVIVCDFNYALRHLPDLLSKVEFKLERGELALIKANICGYVHPSLELLSSLIQLLLTSVKSVVIGETRSVQHEPEDQFRRLGIYDLIKRFQQNVRAVNLSDDALVKARVANPHALGEIVLPKMVLDSDILVNVPRVGAHYATQITCALKNLFGLLPQKRKYSVYHPLGINRVIADVAQVIRPQLNVADAGEKIVLGTDALAVDVVACRFLNINPLRVEHLGLVSRDRNEKLSDFIKRLTVIEV